MGWALILSRAIAPYSAWISVVKMICPGFELAQACKYVEEARLATTSESRRGSALGDRGESNSVKWRTQKDFAGAVEIWLGVRDDFRTWFVRSAA